MYPFYYPYQNSFYMNHPAPFYYDINQVFSYYSMGRQSPYQQTSPKIEQTHTNYSINVPQCQPEDASKKTIPSQSSAHLQSDDLTQRNHHIKPQKNKKRNRQPRETKTEIAAKPKFRYTHKNFQSNIINKIFSFLWSEDKSKSYVQRILKDKTKVALYFDYIKLIRKYCKRYIHKEYLLNLCDYQIEHIAYKIVMKQTQKLKYYPLTEFSLTVRKLISVYLDTVCTTSILTSKKLRTDIWKEHLDKMRNIKDFLFGKINSEEYDHRMNYECRDFVLQDNEAIAQ